MVIYVHISREGVQGLIKVVHLHHYTPRHHDHEGIRTRVSELVVAAEGEFHSDAEAFDGHDRYRSCHGADRDEYDGVRAAIARRNDVNHHQGKHEDGEAI